ncbi:MAG: YdcF family protein [Steroidobacteraceae bacterium]
MDIFLWKQLLKNLVLPPTGPLILGVAGFAVAMMSRRRRRAAGVGLATAALVLLWGFSTPVVGDLLMRSVERYPPLDLMKPVDAQAIVILGGGVRMRAPEYGGHPAPSSTTLQRIVYGAHVAHALRLPVLVSGSYYEAAAMREFLEQDLAVTPRWVENHSRDTEQNAQRSAAILEPAGVHRVVLVTSSEHMARAVVEFEAVGLSVVAAPAEMWTRRAQGPLVWVPSAGALVRSERALYEVLGRLVQTIRIGFTRHGVLRGRPRWAAPASGARRGPRTATRPTAV